MDSLTPSEESGYGHKPGQAPSELDLVVLKEINVAQPLWTAAALLPLWATGSPAAGIALPFAMGANPIRTKGVTPRMEVHSPQQGCLTRQRQQGCTQSTVAAPRSPQIV